MREGRRGVLVDVVNEGGPGVLETLGSYNTERFNTSPRVRFDAGEQQTLTLASSYEAGLTVEIQGSDIFGNRETHTDNNTFVVR